MKNEKEHKFTERDTLNWKREPKRLVKKRPDLNNKQCIVFLGLVSQITSPQTFERLLGLSKDDIKYYMKLLNVETQDEARLLKREMQFKEDEQDVRRGIKEDIKKRKVSETRNKAFKELTQERLVKIPRVKLDINKVRQQDANRQRAFKESKDNALQNKGEVWQLDVVDNESVNRFRRDIVNHGFTFTKKKYDISSAQMKTEAKRLGLKINWDLVKR